MERRSAAQPQNRAAVARPGEAAVRFAERNYHSEHESQEAQRRCSPGKATFTTGAIRVQSRFGNGAAGTETPRCHRIRKP
jgi:hypothetical protein